ncbi:TonB-dependent receptor [Mucilaginibacter phyllosphaerae]|uniref:Iron complex outermembrane receptor protein n=1 Tax=Mucilaginibacter phyllosphaerae TaxID=1812349 RepID=A0A4Y8ADN4_9SPHI|nr:TonB-dependent receptor [Mucilaginibacter phyllosphaerae]MBB3970380.1 iron complex outermembrane receptor protein [Mucilaginibacter phyllosphaerae]TEW66747.1 TonB-dependent siderophore receptor [Mucilaginibacter phyllosphaerae]GGH11645.1 TonB-dependent receptor [Mucilaginibacter phyllosphaerae]
MKRSLPLIKLLAAVLVLLTLLNPASLLAQNKGTIQGKVVANNNQPADNVSIGLEGTSYGTVTKANGEYAFKAPAGSYKIIISYVGVERVEVPVTVTAGQTVTVPQITVRASQSQLIEVNVIANRANRFTRKMSVDVAKIPLNNLENAQSYSVVTSELLKEQNVFNVEDALRNAPGIQKMWDATGRAGDGGGYFTLRGFVTQTRLRNGIAGLITSGIDAVNIDKIEVIKGPSATLFGSTLTSFGGLINRVTKKPYDSFGLEVGHTVGSYDLSRTTIDLNTPLGTNVALRLNSAYNYEGSFQNYGQSRNFAVAPSLAIKANDKLSFLLESEVFVGRNSAKPFFFFDYLSSPKALGVSKVSDLNINYKNAYVNDDIKSFSRSTNYFATVNYKFSDKLTSQTVFSSSNSYSNGASPYFYLVTDARAAVYAPGTPDLPGEANYVALMDQSTFHSKLNAIEIQENINGDFNIGTTRHRFVVGLDFQRQNSNQIYYGGAYGVAPINNPTYDYGSFNKILVDANVYNPAAAYPYIYKTNTYSAYASDVVNITDRLIASAGIRVDRFENKGNYSVTGTQTAEPFSQTAFSPKFGLIYQPIKEALSLFANYQNGFQNLTPYTDAAGQTVTPKIQNATQIEGGVKMALFNGKLNGTLSYYRINLTNVLRTLPGSGAQAIQVQDGTQQSKGFEAEIIANPIASVNIIAGFSYNDSKFTKADADVQGLRPNTAGSPYLANFYASYRLPETALKGLGIGFGGNYASANKIINSVSQGTFELPAYTILNSNLFYAKAKYRFGLSVNNLTNKEYYTGYTTINPQRLRQFVLSASYKL